MSETDFLYPFLDGGESDPDRLLADLAASARAKIHESLELRRHCRELYAAQLTAAGTAMADRFRAGARLYTFGNGGSATDAATVAALFAHPPHGRALPARSLAAEQAVLTALGNDVGFELVFARQLMACGRGPDIAVAISTSGCSADLVTAVAEAHQRGMLCLALSGYDGGRLAVDPNVDFCFTVPSQSVHRIQESQAALAWQLWDAVQHALAPAGNGDR